MRPFILHYQLTERCNLACPGCYLPERTGPGATAAEAEERVFAPLARTGVKFVTLTGGEPLLHPDWEGVVRAAANHFEEVLLVCNGMKLDVQTYARLRDAGLTSLKVSLDGLSDEVHDKLRGREGCFARVMGNLRAILDLPASERGMVDLGLITTIQPQNAADLSRMARWALDKGFDHMLFQPFHPYGMLYPPEAVKGPVERPWYDDAYLRVIEEQVAELSELRHEHPTFLDNGLEMLAALPAFYTNPQGPPQACGVDRYLFVDSAFRARGCLYCDALGTLAEQSPDALYRSEPWEGFQRFRANCTRCLMGCQFVGRAQLDMEEGFARLDDEAYAGAAEMFSRSLEIDYSVPAEHGLGVALKHMGRTGQAVAHLKNAWEHDPRSLSTGRDLADALLKAGRLEEADAIREQVVRLVPEGRVDADVLHLHGLIRMHQGKEAEAREAFAASVAANPDQPYPWFDYGLTLRGTDRDAARSAFAKALALKPDLGGAHLEYGIILQAEGDTDAARTHYERAIEFEPDNAWARFQLGRVLHLEGGAEAAVEHLQRAVELDGFPWFPCRLGDCLADLGRYAEAEAAYRLAISRDGLQPAFHHGLAKTLEAQGKAQEAAKVLARAKELDPDLQ